MPSLFLSPSLQPFNEYAGGGNEMEYMNLIADSMEPYLAANGIYYVRSNENGTLRDAINLSNEANYDLHLALHSNASPPALSGILTGTDVYYRSGSFEGEIAAEILSDNFKNIYPMPYKVKALPTTSLAELNLTRATAVLMEIAYHDNLEDATFIRDNIEGIAKNLVQGLTLYFDIPFISNLVPPFYVNVNTNGGNLNLRTKPSRTAKVIGSIPNGSRLLVTGQWENWYVVNYENLIGYVNSPYTLLTTSTSLA